MFFGQLLTLPKIIHHRLHHDQRAFVAVASARPGRAITAPRPQPGAALTARGNPNMGKNTVCVQSSPPNLHAGAAALLADRSGHPSLDGEARPGAGWRDTPSAGHATSRDRRSVPARPAERLPAERLPAERLPGGGVAGSGRCNRDRALLDPAHERHLEREAGVAQGVVKVVHVGDHASTGGNQEITLGDAGGRGG